MSEVKICDDEEFAWGVRVFPDPYDVAIINDDVCKDCSWYWHCAECSYFPERVAAQTRERERMNKLSEYLALVLRLWL